MTEAGLDSLGAVELHRSLESDFATQLPATLAFDYPTPQALAQYILSLQPAQTSFGEPSTYRQGMQRDMYDCVTYLNHADILRLMAPQPQFSCHVS